VVRTRVDTEAGAFVVEVDSQVAPLTVAHYLAHVDRKLLDGGAVYRIVTLANQAPETRHKIEVVQWGMNRPDGQAPALPPIVHETTRQSGLRHLDGTVSMARAQPGSATAEYFVCVGDQPELDFGGGRNPDGPRLRRVRTRRRRDGCGPRPARARRSRPVPGAAGSGQVGAPGLARRPTRQLSVPLS
jgi:peptidyl-prolyl cis-trans isomerase A (cyclophilin A)